MEAIAFTYTLELIEKGLMRILGSLSEAVPSDR